MAAVERNELQHGIGIPSMEKVSSQAAAAVVSDDDDDDDKSSGDEYSSSEEDEEETEVDESEADDVDSTDDEDTAGNLAVPVPAPSPIPVSAPISARLPAPIVSVVYNAELDPELESKNIILAVLTHGAKCQARKRCPFPNCVESKSMVRHVSRCTDVQCSISYCAKSRFVLRHAQQIQAAILNMARRNATNKPGILQRAAAAAALAAANPLGRRHAAPKRQFSSTMPRWAAPKLSPIPESDNEDSDDEYESADEDQNKNTLSSVAYAPYTKETEYDSHNAADDDSKGGIGATSVDTTDSNSTGKITFYTDEEDSESTAEESEHTPLSSSMPSGESSDQNDLVDNQSDQGGDAIRESNKQIKSKWDVEYSDEEEHEIDVNKPVTSQWEVEYSDDDEEEEDDDINDDDDGQKEFIRSRTWKGSKQGYVFRTTKETGTGYYLDRYEKPPDNKSQWVVEYSDDEEESKEKDTDEPESKVPEKPESASNWDKDNLDDEEVDWQEQRRASPRRPVKPANKSVSSGKASNWVIEYSDDEEEEDETENNCHEIESLPIPPPMFTDDLDGDNSYSDSETSGEEGYLTAESAISSDSEIDDEIEVTRKARATVLTEDDSFLANIECDLNNGSTQVTGDHISTQNASLVEGNGEQIENEPQEKKRTEVYEENGIVGGVETDAKVTVPQRSIADEGDASNALHSNADTILAGGLLSQVSVDTVDNESVPVDENRELATVTLAPDTTQTHHDQEKMLGNTDKVEPFNKAESVALADESIESMLATEHVLGGSEPELVEDGKDKNLVLVAKDTFDSTDASEDNATQKDAKSNFLKTEARELSSLVPVDSGPLITTRTNEGQQANESSDADSVAKEGESKETLDEIEDPSLALREASCLHTLSKQGADSLATGSEEIKEEVVLNERGSREAIPTTKESDLFHVPKEKVAMAEDSATETGSEETNEKDLKLLAVTPMELEENTVLNAESWAPITILTEPEVLEDNNIEDYEDLEIPKTFFDSSMSSIAHALEPISTSSDDQRIYHNVRYRNVTGFLELSPEEIRFVAYDDDGGGCHVQQPLCIFWGDITKLQISPIPHAFTKIVLSSGEWHAFQLNSREVMEIVRVDIKAHMKTYGKSVDKAMMMLKRSSIENLPGTLRDCVVATDCITVDRDSQPSTAEEKASYSHKNVGAISGCANQISAKEETSTENYQQADGSEPIVAPTVITNNDTKEIASVYTQVKFKAHTGVLTVGKGLLSFKSSDDTEFPLTKTFPYNSIAKHQVSPQSQPKAMLKVVSPDGKAATFEVENRAVLKNLKKEISRRRRDYKSTQEEGELSIGGDDARTQNAKAGNTEKSKHRPFFYKNVIFLNVTGTVQLSKDTFTFVAHSPEFSAKSRDIRWKYVKKHQANPKSHIKALLKFVLTSGKSPIFELPSRVELQRMRKEISSLLGDQDQTTPAESLQAPDSSNETKTQNSFTLALDNLGSALGHSGVDSTT